MMTIADLMIVREDPCVHFHSVLQATALGIWPVPSPGVIPVGTYTDRETIDFLVWTADQSSFVDVANMTEFELISHPDEVSAGMSADGFLMWKVSKVAGIKTRLLCSTNPQEVLTWWRALKAAESLHFMRKPKEFFKLWTAVIDGD